MCSRSSGASSPVRPAWSGVGRPHAAPHRRRAFPPAGAALPERGSACGTRTPYFVVITFGGIDVNRALGHAFMKVRQLRRLTVLIISRCACRVPPREHLDAVRGATMMLELERRMTVLFFTSVTVTGMTRRGGDGGGALRPFQIAHRSPCR